MDVHWSDVLRSPIPRINLSFGFLIPKEALNKKYNMVLVKSIPDESTPDHLEVEYARLWTARAFGSVWWWSGEFGKKINTA